MPDEKTPPPLHLFGVEFAANDDINPAALMEFAVAAADGQDADLMDGLASLMRFATECVAEKDRRRFRRVFRDNRGGPDELVEHIIKPMFLGETERPTVGSSDSSDGPSSVEPKPASNSDDKVSEAFPGRPDLQLALLRSLRSA